MHGFKRMLGELDGKDLRQEWQMVTPIVLRECQGKNEGKWEIDNDQVDAIDTHDTFESERSILLASQRRRGQGMELQNPR